MKNKILLVLIITLCICLCISCGGTKENGIIIWSNCTEKEFVKIKEIADNYSKENNVAVNVVRTELNATEYNAVKNVKNDQPDIIWGMSSEELGWLVDNNAIEPINEGMIEEGQYISKDLVENTSLNGERYGIPIYQESIALFYNKDIVKEVPVNMEEFLKLSKEVGLNFNINNGYFSYGFISTQGGYVFENKNGEFLRDNIGLNNSGAIEGYKLIQDICNKYKLIPLDINDNISEVNFANGDVAFYIGESKKIDTFKTLGVNFGVTNIPKINNENFKPFKAVKMAFVNPNAYYKEKSYDLLNKIIEESGEFLINEGDKLPCLKADCESELLKSNEYLMGFYNQIKNAEVTPNIAELKGYWDIMARNLELLNSKQNTPEKCGENIEREIKEYLDLSNK